MIENIIHICQNPKLIDMANDETVLSNFLLPFISDHRRDYNTILALGDIATIEFELEEVKLRSPHDTIIGCTFFSIKRFTRQKLEAIADMFAELLSAGLHEAPYRPDLKALDFDC